MIKIADNLRRLIRTKEGKGPPMVPPAPTVSQADSDDPFVFPYDTLREISPSRSRSDLYRLSYTDDTGDKGVSDRVMAFKASAQNRKPGF